jgi:hypothetical protein
MFGGSDNNDIGLELLMNNKKRQNSDNISLSSQPRSDFLKRQPSVESIKSINIDHHPQPYKNIVLGSTNNSDEEALETESNDEIIFESHERDNEGFNAQNEQRNYNNMKPSYGNYMSEEEIIEAKKDMLYQFDRLEKRGMKLPHRFTLSSSLEEMKMEYDRLKRDKEVDASVKFQRRMMMAFVSGVEYMNEKFDPFDVRLSGWSESVGDDVEDYDEIFEELHEKYRGKAKMAPELKLMMMLGGSGFMFHIQNSSKSSIPGLDQVLKNNPELMRQVAAATAEQMHKESKQTGNGGAMGGLAGLFSSFFGGGASKSGVYPSESRQSSEKDSISISSTPKYVPEMRDSNFMKHSVNRDRAKPVIIEQPSGQMRGPQDVGDLLKELDLDASRIEVMSNANSSEIEDDASIGGLLREESVKKAKRNKRRTLEL